MTLNIILPPKITTDLPKTNPFMSDDWKFWTRRFWRCLLSTCDAEEWEGPIKEILAWYNKILMQKDGKFYLKKNTKLYHGSITYPFLGGQSNPNRMTFFGLDAIISIWYVLEEYLLKNDSKCFRKNQQKVPRYGYLYEFELKEDLEITKIIKLLVSNPRNNAICRQKKEAVCLHPQVSFHGVDSYYRTLPNNFDLCNELTLHYDFHKNIIGIPKRIFMIDPIRLYENRKNSNFNPIHSIVSIDDKKNVDLLCTNYKKKLNYENE
jgi:hypothetical protein